MKHLLIAAFLALGLAACTVTPRDYSADSGLADHGFSNRNQVDPAE